MRVPNPEDPKYYYIDPDGVKQFFYGSYVEDFRKWKAELRKVIAELNCASCDLRFNKPLLSYCQKCVMVYQRLESLIKEASK